MQFDLCRRVRLVEREVDVDADVCDGDHFEEVDRQRVGLRAVGLPEFQGGGVAQGGDAAAGFAGADGPGGEGGDFFEVGRERAGGWLFWVCGEGLVDEGGRRREERVTLRVEFGVFLVVEGVVVVVLVRGGG